MRISDWSSDVCSSDLLGGALAPALRASTGGGDKSHILTPDYEAYFQYTGNKPSPSDWSEWRVRRLMPVECERLQGMPDHYTQENGRASGRERVEQVR